MRERDFTVPPQVGWKAWYEERPAAVARYHSTRTIGAQVTSNREIRSGATFEVLE
jgi:hypothetical protein